ncbi:hypothetical protein SUGI_1116140 [Cryptomeria japonica]|nr:hypothetical protein SUGI_1116140 [Cryptomeria japonica]
MDFTFLCSLAVFFFVLFAIRRFCFVSSNSVKFLPSPFKDYWSSKFHFEPFLFSSASFFQISRPSVSFPKLLSSLNGCTDHCSVNSSPRSSFVGLADDTKIVHSLIFDSDSFLPIPRSPSSLSVSEENIQLIASDILFSVSSDLFDEIVAKEFPEFSFSSASASSGRVHDGHHVSSSQPNSVEGVDVDLTDSHSSTVSNLYGFDFSQKLSLEQSPFVSPPIVKNPKKRGQKPKLAKIKEEIAAGIQSTIVEKFSSQVKTRRACCSPCDK